jgi:hypothetical protein
MSTSCHRISWSHISNEYELSADMLFTDSMTTRSHCWYVINWFYDISYSLLICDQLILWQLVLIADMWSTDSMTTRTHYWHMINWFYDNSYSLLICDQLILWQLVLIAKLITYQQWVRVVIESVDHISAMSTSCHRISWSHVSNEYELS